MRRRFKVPSLKAAYETCRRLAREPGSELFWPDGTPHRTAAPHRAYWLGRDGFDCTFDKTSYAHACWAAGADDRKELGPYEPKKA